MYLILNLILIDSRLVPFNNDRCIMSKTKLGEIIYITTWAKKKYIKNVRLVIHLYEIIEALALHGCTLHFTGSLFNVFVCSIGYICVYLYISLLNYICLVR